MIRFDLLRHLVFLLLLVFAATAPGLAQSYHKARIIASQPEWGKIARLGIALDHVVLEDDFVEGDFSTYELTLARENGYEVQVLEQDAEVFYRDHAYPVNQRGLNECFNGRSIAQIETPEDFSLGRLKGHPSYDEMIAQLDQMAAKYPHLIQAREQIGDFTTFEGRPIYFLKISDNPAAEEDNEPEILYTALHHAREPISMTQMLYYMWYLLENYDTDRKVREVVDNTEMFFVPCVNPDGYIFNERTHPAGGGLWRKNRRSYPDGNIGADLNRNYGHKWGWDNIGSSPDTKSEVYRGDAPFSEPETQAIKHLVENHEFKLALNYHAWGNFLIYPLGYTEEPADDIRTFKNIGDLLTYESRFVHGTGFETVSYFTNGDSDDWMYLDESKNSILSFTAEVGDELQTFWPAVGDVENLCKLVLPQNLNAAFFLLNSGAVVDETGTFLHKKSGELPFRLTKFGFDEVGLQLNFTPLSDNIEVTVPAKFFILDLFSVEHDEYQYTLDPNIQDGEEIVFSISVDNGSYTYADTIRKYYREPNFLIENSGAMQGWTTESVHPVAAQLEGWGESTQVYYSAPSSLTDSPFGNYFPLSTNELRYDRVLELTGADSAVFSFQATWDIQSHRDYMTVEVASNGGEFVPQCGRYTVPGGPRQLFEVPIYSGRQLSWVHEHIDLSEFIGESVQLRFRMVSGSTDSRDGMYLDDLKLLLYNEGIISSEHLIEPSDFHVTFSPNPVTDLLHIESESFDQQKPQVIEVLNHLGQIVHHQAWKAHAQVEVSHWSPGLYFVQIRTKDGRATKAQKFIVH